MADTPSFNEPYVPVTEQSPLNFGPDLLPTPELPTAPSYPQGPTSLQAGDPFASLYTDFNKSLGKSIQQVDYGKQAAPIYFPSETMQFDKWYESWDYAEKGFIPWRDNQETYDSDTNVFKELYRASHYMGPLFFDGFMSGLRTIPDMMDGFFNGNWDAFFGEDMIGAMKQDRAYKMGVSTAGGMSTFATGLGIAASNMAGTLTEAYAETALLAGITYFSGGATAEVTLPAAGMKWTKVGTSIMKGLKNIGTVAETFSSANKMRQAYNSFKFGEAAWTATKGMAKFLNPVSNLTEYGLALYKGEEAFNGVKGFGAFFRDFSELKFALSEAKLEGGFGKLTLQDDLVNQYKLNNDGNLPDFQTSENISKVANANGDAITKFNLPVIYYSNRIGFGNLFKGIPGLNKLMAESESGLFKHIQFDKVADEFVESMKGLTFRQAYRGGLGAIANYTKANFMEGIQESLQEVISGSSTEYYKKQYDNPSYGGLLVMQADVLENIGKQFSAEGFSTFASGFAMGSLVNAARGLTSGTFNLYYRAKDKEGWKEFKQQRAAKVKEYVTALNEVYKDPLKFFDYEMVNAAKQGEFGKFMSQAALNKNPLAFYDIKNEQTYEHLYTVLRSGKLDIFKTKLDSFSKLTDEELKEALNIETEDADKLRERIKDIKGKVDYINKRYEISQEKLKNPINLNAFKKETPEYADAAQKFVAFEDARKQAIFAGYTFDRNAERMQSILKDITNVKTLVNSSFVDFNVLTNPEFYDKEIAILKKEIAEMSKGDEASKKIAQDKKTKLDAIVKWKKAMESKGFEPQISVTVTDPVTKKKTKENQVNPKHEEFRNNAKDAFVNYVDRSAEASDDKAYKEGVDQAFDMFMDYHTLYKQQDNLLRAVNILSDPQNFLKLYESNLEQIKAIYAKRDQILTDAINKALAITDSNDLINKLGKLGYVVDPSDPNKYYKSVNGTFQVVAKNSKDQKIIDALIEDHKKATEKAEEEAKKKEEEEKKKKAEKEEKGKKEKKDKKEKEEDDEDEQDEEDEEDGLKEENGEYNPEMDYMNEHFGFKPRKINYKIKLADNGQIAYAVWSFVGSKDDNVEKSVNTIADLENVLRIKTLMDYLARVQKVYKVDIKDTEVIAYGKPGGKQYKEYQYTGVIPSIFGETPEKPFFYNMLDEEDRQNFDEGFYTTNKEDLEGMSKTDFKAEEAIVKQTINGLQQIFRNELARLTAEMKEKRTVDQKFISSSTNTIKVFTQKDETKDNMRDVVFSMNVDEIKNKMTAKIEKVKPGARQVVFDKTRNKVRLRVYRQSPDVVSTVFVDGNAVGYPTYPDVFTFEIDGEVKTANELTKKEFYLFAQEGVNYEEYMANYRNSLAVYNAFVNILEDNQFVDIANEDLLKIFDVLPVFGSYDFTGKKIKLSSIEKNGIKLIGVLDKTYSTDSVVPGKTLTEITKNREELNKYVKALETDPDTGNIKQFAKQGRYIAVFVLPNGKPAFVEVTSPNLEEDEIDNVYSDIALRLKETYTQNVITDATGKITGVKNKNFNRSFDSFTEDSGRMPFYIAIPQSKTEPAAYSYNVTLAVTANGSIAVNFVNTKSENKEYHKIYVEVKYDEKGNPDLEGFTDMISRINTEIVNYSTKPESNGVELPILKPEYFKAAIPKKTTFAQMSEQVTNVSENIFQNTHLLFFPASDMVKDVDTSTRKTGKKTSKKEPASEPKLDINKLKTLRKALSEAKSLDEIEDLMDDSADSFSEDDINTWVNIKENINFIETDPIISNEIKSAKSKIESQEITTKYIFLAYLDAKIKEIEGAQPVEPAPKKRGGLGLTGLKVDKSKLRQQASKENEEDDKAEKNSGNIKTDSKGNSAQDVNDKYKADLEELRNKYEKNGIIKDLSGYDAERTKLEAEFKKNISQFSKKRTPKLKIVDRAEFDDVSVENIDKFTQWMKKTLPSIDVDPNVVAEKLIDNQVIVGRFLTYVKMTANGPQITGSIQTNAEAAFKYHEAFHAVFTLFLNDEQIDKLLSLARYEVNNKLKAEGKTLSQEVEKMRTKHPMYAEMTTEELTERYLEEYLADQFDKFKMNQFDNTIIGKIREFFAKLLDYINALLGRQSELKTFYKEIDKGKFANVNVQHNRFTKDLALSGNPVIEKFKIKYGEKRVETLNGETIFTPQYVNESDTQRIVGAVVNSFLFRAERNPQLNKSRLLDQILTDFRSLYQIGRYSNLSFDQYERLKLYRDIFDSQEAREDIKANADVFLQLMGYGQNLDDDLEFEEAIQDEGDRATTDKFGEKYASAGIKSFSKFARQYIQSTTYEKQDEFGNQFLDEDTGEPLAFGVNAGIIYNGMVKLMSGVTTQEKFIQRLLHFRNSASEQTAAFINKFLDDTGISQESDYKPVKKLELFNSIFKPFTQFNVPYRSYLFDTKTGVSKSIRANARDAASNQYNQWQNDFNFNYQDNWTLRKQQRVVELFESINLGLSEQIEEISDEDLLTKADELKELERLSGIKIVFEYYKYSVLATLRNRNLKGKSPLTDEQIDFVKSFDGIPILLSEDISEIVATLKRRESPFITFDDVEIDMTPAGTDEDDNLDAEESDPEDEQVSEENKADQAVKYEQTVNKGNRSRLMRIAEGNAMFDETVLSSSWLNAEFEQVSSHQLPNFHLSYLEDTIKNPEALERLINNDPFLTDSYIGQQILNNGEFREILNRLRIERIDGITARKLTELTDGSIVANTKLMVNKRDGITYGKFKEREFILTNLLMYLEDREVIRKPGGEEIVTSRHLIRVIESKNTGDTINMPVISTIIGMGNRAQLSETAENILLQEFMAEFNRIARVNAEKNNPDRDIIQGYNDFDNSKSPLRGLKFRTFEDILGNKVELYRNIALSDNPTLNKKQIEDVKKLINEYFLGNDAKDQPGLVDDFVNMMDEAGLIFVNKEDKYRITNKMLPAEIYGAKMNNPTQRMNDLHLGKDPRANIAQMLVNDFINTLSINKLYYGDQATSLKDFVDAVKRAAGAAGSGHNMATSLIDEEVGITHSHQHSHVVTHVDPTYNGEYSKSKDQKWADAQTWSTVKTARYNAHGLGRLNKYKAAIFDKLERGEPLTAEEVFGINGTINNNAQLKVEKLVYFDGKKYIKTSVFFLTKEFTSQLKLSAKRKINELKENAKLSEKTKEDYLEQIYAIQRDNSNWVARPGRQILHDKRVGMEEFENKNSTTVYSIPVSASKMINTNVSQSLEDFSISDKQAYRLDNRYMRLQLENTTNKKGGINDSTQMQTIIDTEQNPNTIVNFKGKPTKVKDVISEYQNALAQKAKLSYLLARNNIFSFEDVLDEFELSVAANRITPNLAKFQEKALENLKQTGASQQLLEFFELEVDPETGEKTPTYDLNTPFTRKKYEQLFLAYFRRDVLQQKTPGQALTLASDWGAYSLKRAKRIIDGKVVEWEVVRVDQQEASGKEYRPMSDREKLQNKVSIEEGQLTDEERYLMYLDGEKIPSGLDDYEFFHKSIDDVTEVGELFTDRLRHNWPVYDEAGNITGYKTEFMMPHHYKESMSIGVQDEIPKALLDHFAARIPGQDKHSAASLDLVDFLPAYYGSMTMLAREVLEISGADNDVDKAYTHFTDFYTQLGSDGKLKFYTYGTETSDSGRYLEYFLWNIANNKILLSEIKSIKDSDEDYKKIKGLLDKLYLAKEHILKFKKRAETYSEELNQVDRAIDIMLKMDEVDEPSTDLDDIAIDEYKKLRGNATEFVRDQILKLDGLIEDIWTDIQRSGVNINRIKQRINELKREKLLLERIIQFDAMEKLNLPIDVESFLDYEDLMGGEEVNIGVLNNTILEAKRALLTNDYMQEDGRAFEVADQGVLQDLENDKDIAPFINPDSTIDADNYVGKILAQRNNKEGSRNIGSVVNGQMSNTFLMKHGINFRRKPEDAANQVYILTIDDTEFDTYKHERKALITDDYEVVPNFKSKKTKRTMYTGSGYVSAMTDNAKDRRSAKFSLNINAAAIAMDLNGRGVPDKLIIAILNNRVVKEYYRKVKAENYAVSQSEKKESAKKIASKIKERLIKKAGGDSAVVKPLTTRLLLDALSSPTPESDLSVFDHFLSIESQSRAHGVLSQILKLTKGPSADMRDWDKLKDDAYEYLGIGMTEEQFKRSNIPYDVRDYVLSLNPFIAAYWNINKELNDQVGKTVLISRSELFKKTKDSLLSQVVVPYSLQDKFIGKLENNILMYFALRGYMTTLRAYDDELLTLLHNNLVYGTSDESDTITDIIKEGRRNNPDNYLINKYLRLVPKTVIQKGKEVINKDNKKKVHILEPSTYGTLDPYMLSKIQNSFMELYENDRKTALAIFAYSIVKDATLFSPNGIMHIFPPFFFKELMGDTMFNVGKIFKQDNLEEYLSQGKNATKFAKYFGGSFKEVVADFMQAYLRHVENKYYLRSVPVSYPSKEDKIVYPVRYTSSQETGKVDDKQIIIDIFTDVKPTKIKYKKKKDDQQDDDETNVEESKAARYKLDKRAKQKLLDNIKALKSTYKIITTSDDKGNIGLQLPYTFKVPSGKKGFRVYVLQNISKVSDQEKMENVNVADVLTDKFNIVAPRAIYKLADSEGAYGTTPIGSVFGDLPLYSELNKIELVAAERKELLESKKEQVEEDDEESDLDVSTPDKPLKRPSNVEDEETEVLQQRDVDFLKSKGITATIKNGEYIYKKNGKTYNFEGSPRELADLIDDEGDFKKAATKKQKAGKKTKSGTSKFYDPAYGPTTGKGKKTRTIPKVSKVDKVEDEDITQSDVDDLLEDETNITGIRHYDGKKYIKYTRGNKPTVYGTYKTKIKGLSAIDLIKSGIKTELSLTFNDIVRDINELFILEDTDEKSPTFGEQVVLRATTAPYKPTKATYTKYQGWDESVWDGRKARIEKTNELSFRFEYVGSIEDGKLVLSDERSERPVKEKKKETKESTEKIKESAFKTDKYVPKKGSVQESITNELEDVMSESALKAGYLKKEQYKSKRATQFIGKGAQNRKGEDSSTERFRKLYDSYDIANTGDYTADDIVWVSVNGNRADRVKAVVDGKLQGEYKNITLAMKVGASIIMDTAEHIASNKYNVGEVEVAAYLSKNGYQRDDSTGVWTPKSKKQETSEEIVPVKKFSLGLGKLKVDVNKLRQQTATENEPDDDKLDKGAKEEAKKIDCSKKKK